MAVDAAKTGWSADGNWFWDGAGWNDAVSEDGQWRFDGNTWQPFAGQRSAMPPMAAPPAPAPPPPPTPAAIAAPGHDMPSWVDPSEVERIAREKQKREAIAAEPVAPLPPEQDWRHAGEFIQYSHTATVPFWKVGYSSLFIYLGLLWVCSPLALIYIWMTEWRMFTKVYRTGVALLFVAALMNYIARRTGLG